MTPATESPVPTERILEQFGPLEAAPRGPAWLLPLRKSGLARFSELGFPSPQHEEWRYTPVQGATRLPFVPALEPAHVPIDLGAFLFTDLPAHRLVFVNGHFHPGLSTLLPDTGGAQLGSLAAALESAPDGLERSLGRLVRGDESGFAALNTAFFKDGALLRIPRGVTVRDPVHLLFITVGDQPGRAAFPRVLLLAEPESQITVLEHYVGTGSAPYVTHPVTEIHAGEASRVEHCILQQEKEDSFHFATLRLQMEARAEVISHSIALGSELARKSIHASLAGPGVECIMNGLYLVHDRQLIDHYMVVEHASPHCNSHEYYNGILDGRGRGVFHGRILVRPGAVKTDAKQTNKNLLLSDEATIDTKPQLEIYADDVKCTHGATVGQLDEPSIYYLRSRGIGAELARRMLIHGFAGEITDRVRHPALRERLDRLIWDRLEEMPLVAG